MKPSYEHENQVASRPLAPIVWGKRTLTTLSRFILNPPNTNVLIIRPGWSKGS